MGAARPAKPSVSRDAAIPFSEIRHWLFEQALPFWARFGVDEAYGGFLEEVGADGAATDCSFKRTRVTCRQVYVFSHAAIMGWENGQALAQRGCDYLSAKAYLGPERGWARQLSRAGAVIDDTPDLYDIAFVLFAYAWRHRASNDPSALASMHEVLDFVQSKMRLHEGFAHALPMIEPRLQNPHMHLLEACLAAFETTQHISFLDQARELATLFRTRLFDGATLGEYFTEDWRRVPGEAGLVVEPGHMFEWAWILARYAALTDEAPAREARVLVEFAEKHGVNRFGATINACRADGSSLDGASRLWPNTERIKGHLALFELTGQDPRAAVAASVRLLMERYLKPAQPGAWIDALSADGQAALGPAPASTFYHIFLAFAEVLRLQPRLSALD